MVAGSRIGWPRGIGRVAALLVCAGVTACATAPAPLATAPVGGVMAPYQVRGVWYRPRIQPHYDVVGIATWYGAQYHHRTFP